MPSPACEIKEGAGAYAASTNGFDATPAAAITIHLIDTSANSWDISCVTTDDLSDAAAVTAALSIDPLANTATFTAPVAGRAYRFRSRVNGGIGPNGRAVASYSTTFCVYTTTGGRRVFAADETTEGDATFGWVKWLNDLIRNPTTAAAGGSDTELQRNNGGILGGITSWVWNAANSRVRVGSAALELRNPAGTFGYIVTAAALAADRVLNLPLLTGTDTLAVLSLAQTLENKTLASPTITGTVTYQGTKLRILSIPGEAQTTTATTAVIASFAMLDETSCTFDFTAHMTGSPAATKGGRWDGKVTYRRTAAGAPTIVGAAEYGTPQESVAGDDVAFNVSGNTIQVLATAADADDRNWTCELRVHETLATA